MPTEKPKSAGVAVWSCSIYIECPHCGADNDLCENDDGDWRLPVGLELGEHGTDRSKNIEVDCSECRETFIVDDLEW